MSDDRFKDDPYPGGAPHNSTDTSIAAAKQQKGNSQRDRQRVYDHILRQGLFGSTDDEGHKAIGMNHYTYAPRRNELVMDGYVFDSGARRKTERGSSAIVWKAKPVEGGKLPKHKARKPIRKHCDIFIELCYRSCKYWPEELKAKLRKALDDYQGDGNEIRRQKQL